MSKLKSKGKELDGVIIAEGQYGAHLLYTTYDSKPRRRPRRLYADRGYDHDKYRRLVRARGITPVIARRGVGHGSGLGTVRWPVERTFAWFKGFRRLRLRTERRADVHQAMLSLACSIICLRKLILN